LSLSAIRISRAANTLKMMPRTAPSGAYAMLK